MSHLDLSPSWHFVKQLFTQYQFITIVCAFLLVAMTIGCYRFLKSVSPALPPVIMLLILVILMLHWTQTRTEPKILSPAVDLVTRIIPSSNVVPAKPPPPPKRVT